VTSGYQVDVIMGHLPSGMTDKSTQKSLEKVFVKMLFKEQKRRK